MDELTQNLNKSQIQAVEHDKGPMLMLAGAGSGKTKTLTHRIAYLIKSKKIPVSSILAVTFTNKAAKEMKDRLLKILGKTQDITFLGTFHSVAVKILRIEAEAIGYSKNFLIYDQSDQLSLIKQIIKDFELDETKYQPQLVAHMISSAKNELISFRKYAEIAANDITKVTARVYERYQQELKRANSFDFDDLIAKTVELFQKNPQVLDKYRSKFRYIMIDEYQDTNQAQYVLINLLVNNDKNICVVGDDWQSIYSWRGANYQNILNFEKDYPQAKIIKLEQNYRSTQNILDAAHSVISKNITRSDKKLWTDSKSGEKIQIQEMPSEMLEGQFVVETIEDLLSEDKSLNYKNFAVLYRTNAQSRSLEDTFLRYQIPYQIVGGLRFYERKEIKDILAYLRFILQKNDQVSFERIVNLPPRGVGNNSLKNLLSYCKKTNTPLAQAIEQCEQIEGVSAQAKKGLLNFYEIVQGLRAGISSTKVSEFVDLTMKRSGYLEYLNDRSLINEDRIENLKELVSVAKAFDKLNLDDFLSEVSLLSDIDSHSSEQNSVTLMTLHSAKGLEFDTVFITGVEENIFPHSRSVIDNEQLEEERRLMYVGMTRAKKRLFLINATSRMIYGSTQYNSPSRFISDIPDSLIQKNGDNFRRDRAEPRLSGRDSSQKNDLRKGDRVFHPYFGEGKVLSIEDEFANVDFRKKGIKDLNLEYAPLKKLV